MSERELTTLLSLMTQRQACLSSACKEIADWIDRQGDVPPPARSALASRRWRPTKPRSARP